MAHERKNGLTTAEKDALWARFKSGQSFVTIARALNRPVSSIYSIVREHGGIVPPVRRRAAQTFTLRDRETISRGLSAGVSIRGIAASLGRAPSTISREVTRNGGADRYRAVAADARAWRAARRPKVPRLDTYPHLHRLVVAKLRANWSPAQIAGWLLVTYPDDPTWHVSHETIYRSLFLQARGALKRELTAHLRTRRPIRRSKHATTASDARGLIVDAVSIAERPPSVADRAVPGHWEGDLLSGAKNTHIATLVERTSRYVQLVRVAGKDTTAVITALIREVQQLPDGVMASLTWDRGQEMAHHHRFTVATDVAVYFCDPQRPWQRGTNENTNGLLRQYFPDGTDLSVYSQRDLNRVAGEMNTRPRKTLGFRTAAAMFAECVALTR